jgi:hypothetical protein
MCFVSCAVEYLRVSVVQSIPSALIRKARMIGIVHNNDAGGAWTQEHFIGKEDRTP